MMNKEPNLIRTNILEKGMYLIESQKTYNKIPLPLGPYMTKYNIGESLSHKEDFIHMGNSIDFGNNLVPSTFELSQPVTVDNHRVVATPMIFLAN